VQLSADLGLAFARIWKVTRSKIASHNLSVAVHSGCQQQSYLFWLMRGSICAETLDTASLSKVEFSYIDRASLDSKWFAECHSGLEEMVPTG
jgi:hypothetical protein